MLEQVGGGEAGVEEAGSGADDGAGRFIFSAWDGPGDRSAWAEVGVVGDAGLGFKAQAVAESDVGLDLPVVFGVDAGVDEGDGDVGVALGLAELAGSSAFSTDGGSGGAALRGLLASQECLLGDLVGVDGGVGELAVEVGGGIVGVAYCAEASAEVDGARAAPSRVSWMST